MLDPELTELNMEINAMHIVFFKSREKTPPKNR